jgi:hypothetical protein
VPDRSPDKPAPDYRGNAGFLFEVVGGRAKEIKTSRRISKKQDRIQFEVWLTFGSIDGRTRCVGVEIRSYERIDHERGVIEPFESRDGLAEISAAMWRSIPIGELIERGIAGSRAQNKMLADITRNTGVDPVHGNRTGDAAVRRYESLIGDDVAPDRPRRGPQRVLSPDELATVVAPAYLAAGRKPVVAVRDALTKYKRQTISMDQARKAVVRAREAGVLPPAHGQGKP